MSVHASPLAHAYHQRHGTFVSDERFGDWRLKLYGLAAPERGVRPELLDVTASAGRAEPAAGRRRAITAPRSRSPTTPASRSR